MERALTAPATQPATRITTEDLEGLLRAHLPSNRWALMFGVRNFTGWRYGARERYADAVAMHLWPSSGMELHGFELKVSRSDWLRELRDPSKADAVSRFCERWWLVVADDSVVQPGELPAGWGMLAPRPTQVFSRATGTYVDTLRLEPVVRAKKRAGAPLERDFIASMLRAAQKARDAV